MEQGRRAGREGGRRLAAAGLVGLLLVAAVAGQGWLRGGGAGELASLGYAGLFLLMVASGGSTLFPVPGQVAVVASGAIWDPLLVGLAAGLGNATGETVAFLVWRAAAGALGERVAQSRFARLFSGWFRRNGFLAVLAIAAIPNPVFDFVGIVAATAGYPAGRFWLACALGNSAKYLAMAYTGKAGIGLLALSACTIM